MLVNGKSPEGIEAVCEGCCPAHSSSVRKLHRATKRSIKHTLKRREARTWKKEL